MDDKRQGNFSNRRIVRCPRRNLALQHGVLVVILFAWMIGCAPEKPTEAECISSYQNMVRLMQDKFSIIPGNPSAADDQAARKMAPLCVERKSRKRVQCEIQATTLDQIKECKRLQGSR